MSAQDSIAQNLHLGGMVSSRNSAGKTEYSNAENEARLVSYTLRNSAEE